METSKMTQEELFEKIINEKQSVLVDIENQEDLNQLELYSYREQAIFRLIKVTAKEANDSENPVVKQLIDEYTEVYTKFKKLQLDIVIEAVGKPCLTAMLNTSRRFFVDVTAGVLRVM